ncbi:MAG: endo-1,4-beta-xylanase [Defluviitaleaceae bacterium]|nr:endo-1,4-beta-xylanase [Defluviitaleaceae bacterium]
MKLAKKLLIAAIITVFAVIPTAVVAQPAASAVTVDGQAVVFDGAQAVNVDDRILVPVRGVFEALGFTVEWEEASRTAVLTRGGYVVRIPIDSQTFTTNGVNHTLDVPAQIINDRTMLPIRAVVESVGYNVEWDEANLIIMITTGQQAAPTPDETPTSTEIEPLPEPTPAAAPVVQQSPTRAFEGIFDFETNLNGVTAHGGSTTITRTRDMAHTGNYSVLVDNRSADGHGIRFDVTDYAFVENRQTAQLYVRPAGNQPITFQMTVEFTLRGTNTGRTMWCLDTYQNELRSATSRVTARPGEWTEFFAFRPFYDFDSVVVTLVTYGNPNASFYVDDFTFGNLAPAPNIDLTLPRLFEAYRDYFIVGMAGGVGDLRPGPRFDLTRHHFNAFTAGNCMKPDALQPNRGQFNWIVADEMVASAAANNIHVVGHTLAWHAQSPGWMNPAGVSRDDAIRNLEDHVTAVATRYRGQIIAWDVVNEAMNSWISLSDWNANPVWQDHLRDTPWLRAIGPEYIEIAFRAAYAADPSAILIYNDYNLNFPGKRLATYHMVRDLLERGVPIHGVGMQGHYTVGGRLGGVGQVHSATSLQEVRDSVSRFSSLKNQFPFFQLHITELDITAHEGRYQASLPAYWERRQAIHYAEMFRIFREYSHAIYRVTIWGICDATSWRNDRFPLLFNSDLSAKEAFFAVLDPEAFLADPDGFMARFR